MITSVLKCGSRGGGAFRTLLRKRGIHFHNIDVGVVHKNGKEILSDPWYNKGTAFSVAEKDRLGLRGLLPPTQLTIEQQATRFLNMIRDPRMSPMDKWRELSALQDRNETLFYKVIIENIGEFAPIVYTPTVGQACQKFSAVFRQSRGIYFSLLEKGEGLPVIYNWPSESVDIICVTDGSRILGLGDLGVQGMGISIGKLVLYVAAAGLDPTKTLPVCIDVGTNNKDLLNTDNYLGLHQPRCDDDEYFELMDEFMDAVYSRWPNALVQFEDFANERAVKLLAKYRHDRLCFNDDIQGTGATTVGGILCAVRAKGGDVSDICKQTFVVVGAGSAGIGVAKSILQSMVKYGLSIDEARKRFYFVDDKGLLTTERIKNGTENLLPGQLEFLQDQPSEEGSTLIDTIRLAQPSVILGLSGVGGLFTEEICTEMGKINDQPIIFPMSNPSSKAECSAEVAFNATEGRAIFASGSPFDNVTLPNGKVCITNQANNMFIFPGLGLGVVLAKAKYISDEMLMVTAEALAKFVSPSEVASCKVYPDVDDIRSVSKSIAVAVIKHAVKENNCKEMFYKFTSQDIEDYVEEMMYQPRYAPLVYRDLSKVQN